MNHWVRVTVFQFDILNGSCHVWFLKHFNEILFRFNLHANIPFTRWESYDTHFISPVICTRSFAFEYSFTLKVTFLKWHMAFLHFDWWIKLIIGRSLVLVQPELASSTILYFEAHREEENPQVFVPPCTLKGGSLISIHEAGRKMK